MAEAPGPVRRFDNQVALVSGGLGAMGLAIARRLAGEGARVALGDLAPPPADLAAQFQREGLAVPAVFALDVTDAESWARCVAAVQQQLGPLDVLVNNAGVVMAGDPLGRIVEAADVAAAVAFLASQDARMVTGADLVVDGGRLIQ